MSHFAHRQRGATLIVSLVMLVLITLLAVSSFSLGKGNVQIVGNMQQRTQAFAAAQQAIATTISSTQFTATPTNAIPVPCVVGPNTVCMDVNGDGGNDVTVVVTPTCDSIQPIPVTQLNFNNPADAGCLIGQGQDFGVTGAANGNSMCSNSVWDVQASATDNLTGANFTIDQGVGVRVPATTICP